MAPGPGTPRLLRALNDRAALEALLSAGPLTRAQIGERTGLSKVTAAELLNRLKARRLVQVVGTQAGGRGPNAVLYAITPGSAHVAGVDVGPRVVTAGIADITGTLVSQVTVDPSDAEDPVAVVHLAVLKACERADVSIDQLSDFVIGTPGVVDPRTGDVQFAFDLPAWHEGVLAALRSDLRRPVVIENDVNLVALAERAYGVAQGHEDFALLWIDRGIGLAVTLGGRLHRGVSGGAGEIGYLPVPGVPLPEGVTESATGGMTKLAGGFASLMNADEIGNLSRAHGFAEQSAAQAVQSAVTAEQNGDQRGDAFLDELARRLSYGAAAVNIVLDPGLLVLAGALGQAGGAALADRVERAVARISPTRPRVATTEVEGNPVLRGALHAALERAREGVFSTTTA
ncbi:ROK family transcriptional regulator [Nocardia sp. XZ_19_385]|uniref:ROK family transcriptional regulator n=1 Tax=Nocardia sp. XZ_19_385 TaxID=2769488 RepID=UPI001890A905|nr:ROK family transcriptional regulator [Nocardia sp. XZ_19_385]